MVREEAMSYLESYIAGTIHSSDANFKSAIAYLASNYGSSIKKYGFKINGYDADRYDNLIKAWSYFWKTKFSSKGYDYNNSYIKAMLSVETKIGVYAGTRNGKVDVMQCLDAENPAVYCMAKIKPSNGTSYDSNEGLSYGMQSSGYKGLRNIFSSGKPQASKCSSNLSICFGILWLGYKTAWKGSITAGIKYYNGLGNASYLSDVKTVNSNPKAYFMAHGYTVS